MFDQLAPSQEQTPRRLPVLERRNTYTPQQDPRGTQRYDVIAPCGRTPSSPEGPRRQEQPPHEAGGFGRPCSSPEETAWRQGEPPVLFSRLPTAPAWFPSPQEEVQVMQQSAREAWTQLGRRFRRAHPNAPAARTSRTTRKPSLLDREAALPPYGCPGPGTAVQRSKRAHSRRSSAPDAPSHVPSGPFDHSGNHKAARTREPPRRSSVASGARSDHTVPSRATGVWRSAASPECERRSRAPGTW